MQRHELDAVLRARMLLLGGQFRLECGEPDVAEDRVRSALAILTPIISRSVAYIIDPAKAPSVPVAPPPGEPVLLHRPGRYDARRGRVTSSGATSIGGPAPPSPVNIPPRIKEQEMLPYDLIGLVGGDGASVSPTGRDAPDAYARPWGNCWRRHVHDRSDRLIEVTVWVGPTEAWEEHFWSEEPGWWVLPLGAVSIAIRHFG